MILCTNKIFMHVIAAKTDDFFFSLELHFKFTVAFTTLSQLWHAGLVAPRHVGGLPGLVVKALSPALAGGFFTTGPSGKS